MIRSRVPSSAAVLLAGILASSAFACGSDADGVEAEAVAPEDVQKMQQELHIESLPNNLPILNRAGTAGTYSTQGHIDLTNPFHVPQGANGRACDSCHLVTAGWSMQPLDLELRFWLTDGTDPVFNLLDANTATSDVSTTEARYASYSMLRKGLFRRGGNVSATAEFTIVAVDDPLGANGGSTSKFTFYRRPLATSNFHLAKNVGWHDQNTNGTGNVILGLDAQAKGNITGGQQGAPATQETLDSIVGYEMAIAFAQMSTWGAGRLDKCGATGGPENLSQQAFVAGPFNLYDAWTHTSGHCRSAKREQIARGQALFNTKTRPSGGTCLSCHNAQNNGSHVAGVLFNVRASDAAYRTPDMPLYTVRNKTTGEEIQTTDPGRALATGKWADMNRFKVPSMRGLVSRAPYFHNGIAKTLPDVVHFYEEALGFDYTRQEEEDLVAFLEAL